MKDLGIGAVGLGRLGYVHARNIARSVPRAKLIAVCDMQEELAKAAAVAVAESFEERNKFEEAFYKWSEVQDRWQNEPIGKDALLAKAHCKHALYRGPRFDDSDLIGRPLNPESYYNSAKACYEQFKSRYPQDAKKYEIDKKLKRIEEQSALKQFKIAQYYQKTGSQFSAKLYYQMVVDDWPQTVAAKRAREILAGDSGSQEKKQ